MDSSFWNKWNCVVHWGKETHNEEMFGERGKQEKNDRDGGYGGCVCKVLNLELMRFNFRCTLHIFKRTFILLHEFDPTCTN